jgi:predicted transcriptional regulator
MHRTTITLPDELAKRVGREARRQRTSVSAVVRGALEREFTTAATRKRKKIAFAAIVDDANAPPARQIDSHLARHWADAIDRDRR